jgi:hypothetical protein
VSARRLTRAAADDLDRYLSGVEHDEVSEFAYDHVEYGHADGHAPLRGPAEESFWTASATGSGDFALD